MRRLCNHFIPIFIYCVFTVFNCDAQEQLAPVNYNPWLHEERAPAQNKTTALSLPFFEDFTSYGVFPDNSKWTDHEVYVNNTMCQNPISRGVATFDALNGNGLPYNTANQFVVLYADSLTSRTIDLSTHTPADSIYLSFFYQPQGNGFPPETGDSLMLYFKKKYGPWTRVWAKEGNTVQDFKQVMLAVKDTAYFNDAFQFRFINIASINIDDDVWNVDYIRMDAGRNINDTLVNDVAATLEPFYLLNDYTYMPYRQFMANANAERGSTQVFRFRNNYTTSKNVSYGYTATETTTSTALGNGSNSGNIAANTEQQFSFPMYTTTVTAPGMYNKIVFESKYFITPISGSDPRENDTIVRQQVFDNYLAYDDGTAEKSYFLKLFTTLPGKTAIDFHLNQADTLRGVAIYLGRQVPLATQKYFSVFVNKDIAVNGGTDIPIFQQDLYIPSYADTVNHFWIYKFDEPLPMNAGTFYLGTIQPANSGSDSLYFGFDVNRIGSNHLYYNVLNSWQPSSFNGVLMIRPLLGQPIIASDVKDIDAIAAQCHVYPNPAKDFISIDFPQQPTIDFIISDMQGRVVCTGNTPTLKPIDITRLPAGVYLLKIKTDKGYLPKKIIKL